jgi:nucleotide-binding universal stress UspA family protein
MDGSESQHSARAPIVVGVDGTPASVEALAFALHEGALRGTNVRCVTAWHFDAPDEGWLAPENMAQARGNAKTAQDRAVAAAQEQVQSAPVVTREVVQGAPGPVLVYAARDAAYLVVGTMHKNVARRTLLGSVSHYCVQHATVPVVVVPGPAPVRRAATQPAGRAGR